MADALKSSLGKDYPIEFYVDGIESGIPVQQNLELARALEGKIDVLAVRYGIQDHQHPTGFTSTRSHPSPCVDLASALTQDIHLRGGKLLVGISSGLHDPDFCENLIRSEKADLIIMARTWICEPDYMQKLQEGRGEDVVPCVRCNKCHVPNGSDSFRSFCTVNPRLGMEEKIDRMILPVTAKKKVAVVGGGPGGMYAAMTAAKRGHDVTLYEKEAKLGGQLSHTEFASFKWPLADFKNYLELQCRKAGVKILLNTFATKEMLEKVHYDDVIVAVGATFEKADIPGAEGDNVHLAVDVYGKTQELPKRIAVIGGAETGVETGMYLAETGHEVTVMCRKNALATDAAHAHYHDMLEAAWKELPSFHELCGVQEYVSIDKTGVTYVDANGQTQKLEADAVVMATGAKANKAGAVALYGAAPRTEYIGDCRQVGNVHFAVQTGYGAANQI
jgi:thioredoxin reductase